MLFVAPTNYKNCTAQQKFNAYISFVLMALIVLENKVTLIFILEMDQIFRTNSELITVGRSKIIKTAFKIHLLNRNNHRFPDISRRTTHRYFIFAGFNNPFHGCSIKISKVFNGDGYGYS